MNDSGDVPAVETNATTPATTAHSASVIAPACGARLIAGARLYRRQHATPSAKPKRQRTMPQSNVVSMPVFDRCSSAIGAAMAVAINSQLRMPSHTQTRANTTYVHHSVLIDQLGPFHVRWSCTPMLCSSNTLETTAAGLFGPVNASGWTASLSVS